MAPSDNGVATLAARTLVEVRDLGKRYGDAPAPVIEGATFSVSEGEFLSIVGPSGCGKSTLLRLLSGLLAPTTGEVRIAGRPITEPQAELALVFQDYSRSLFPWLTVLENVRFPIARDRDLSRAERTQRALAALEEVGLAHVPDRYPWQLSGGMQQRVAIARGIVGRPKLLLLDEPFASVDALTRAGLEDLVLRVQHDLADYRTTLILVTHDIDEAVYMSDRIVVLGGSPTGIVSVVDIDLARPRAQLSTRSDARFLDLRNDVFALIGREERHVHQPEGAT